MFRGSPPIKWLQRTAHQRAPNPIGSLGQSGLAAAAGGSRGAAAEPRIRWAALVLDPHVVTFFYGSYINPGVLGEVDLVPDRFEVARLAGFDIAINPLANLVPSENSIVYGVLTEATHEELDRLYQHAREVLGGVYLPRPVVAETLTGYLKPALCYIAPELSGEAPSPEYVERIVEPARAHGFPDWYIRRLKSFAP